MAKPRGVFTVDCPERSNVVVPTNEYKIFGPSGRELMVVKNKITIDDVKKAAICGKMSTFAAYMNGSSRQLMKMDFPISNDLVIIPVSSSSTSASVPSTPSVEYKIFRASDNKLLQVVKGSITKSALDKSAKCAGFNGGYTVYGKNNNKITSTLINCDVYLRRKETRKPDVFSVCESTSVAPVRKPIVKSPTFIISSAVDGRQLMEVADFITIDDVKKAVKCAKIHPTEAYVTKVGCNTKLIGSDFPQRNNLIIHRTASAPKRKPEVFSVCESTTVAPVRVPEPVVIVSTGLTTTSKQKLIQSAIKGLESAISALVKLQKII